MLGLTPDQAMPQRTQPMEPITQATQLLLMSWNPGLQITSVSKSMPFQDYIAESCQACVHLVIKCCIFVAGEVAKSRSRDQLDMQRTHIKSQTCKIISTSTIAGDKAGRIELAGAFSSLAC